MLRDAAPLDQSFSFFLVPHTVLDAETEKQKIEKVHARGLNPVPFSEDMIEYKGY